MSKHQQTPEEIAAAQAAAAQAAADKAKADKAAAKEVSDAAKAQAKADREAAKAAKTATADAKKAEMAAAKQAKLDEKANKAQAIANKKAEKEAAKAAKLAAKDAQRQPEQNGIRRPGPDGLCGRVWGLADKLSTDLGQPVPVADLLPAGEADGLNTSNIRTEYARWKKFHGLTGRIVKPVAEPAAPAA